MHKFTDISPYHKLEIFDKLVSPILNYSAEVWGIFRADKIEIVHMQFCKRLLGIKKFTQNDFVYGEHGRTSFQNSRYYMIIKYWLKIILCDKNKYIHNMMIHEMNRERKLGNFS